MAVGAVVTAFLPFLDKILDMIPNPEARAKAKQELTLELIKIEAQQNMAQVELNKQEASHSSIFVAGWRPFIGWVGGFSLAWTFLVQPMLVWLVTVMGYAGTFPVLDTGPLLTLVFAMLGVGTMRSFDKYSGTDTKAVGVPKPKTKPTYNE